MEVVTTQELRQVEGGGWTILKYFGIGLAAGVTFIASIVYGYFHPEKC